MSIWDFTPTRGPRLQIIGSERPPVEESPKVRRHRIMGLDLGQSHDPAACALIDRYIPASDFIGPLSKRQQKCSVPVMKRWDLGTDYCEIAEYVCRYPWDVCVPDFNGVGRPVVDVLRREMKKVNHKGRLLPVLSTGPQARAMGKIEERGPHYTVPKKDLIASLLVLRERGLLMLPDHPTTRTLLDELQRIKKHVKRTGPTFDVARGPGHGDLVSALCLAAWFVLRFNTREFEFV